MSEESALGLTFMAGLTAQHWCIKVHNIIEELCPEREHISGMRTGFLPLGMLSLECRGPSLWKMGPGFQPDVSFLK